MGEVEKITYLSLGFVGVILLVWWLVRHQKKTEKMHSARIGIEVERLGLSFQGDSDPSAGELLAPHPLGKWGSAKGARSVARGSYRGHPLVAFEFSYVVSTGKSSHTVRQTVVILENSKSLPDLELCAEGVLDRFKEYFGAQDFDFSAHPAFSKKYRLRGTDEDSIRDLFRPEVREYFENNDMIHVDIKEQQILIYKPGKYAKEQGQFEEFLQRAVEILELLTR
ncbi:MAG: hypothetical protein DSY81_12220 [Bacillota bacterium]|nr:MAG: hypothetical protein DSY81_12220 [Bacillota bacterium]